MAKYFRLNDRLCRIVGTKPIISGEGGSLTVQPPSVTSWARFIISAACTAFVYYMLTAELVRKF